MPDTTSEQVTRREFVSRCAAAAASGAALVMVPGVSVAATSTVELREASSTSPRTPVVSFHVDRPYLDTNGRAIPYLPPAGTRSGQPLAELSHEEYLRRYGYR